MFDLDAKFSSLDVKQDDIIKRLEDIRQRLDGVLPMPGPVPEPAPAPAPEPVPEPVPEPSWSPSSHWVDDLGVDESVKQFKMAYDNTFRFGQERATETAQEIGYRFPDEWRDSIHRLYPEHEHALVGFVESALHEVGL